MQGRLEVWDLLHVSKDVHTTAEEVLSLLAVKLIDKRRRVVVVCILVPAMIQRNLT